MPSYSLMCSEYLREEYLKEYENTPVSNVIEEIVPAY